jgi:hypothetical protein
MKAPRKGDQILTLQGVWYWVAFVKDGWGVMAWPVNDPNAAYSYVRDSDVVARVHFSYRTPLPEGLL